MHAKPSIMTWLKMKPSGLHSVWIVHHSRLDQVGFSLVLPQEWKGEGEAGCHWSYSPKLPRTAPLTSKQRRQSWTAALLWEDIIIIIIIIIPTLFVASASCQHVFHNELLITLISPHWQIIATNCTEHSELFVLCCNFQASKRGSVQLSK